MYNLKEEWKSIVGYIGFYEVSNRGNVRSLDRAYVNARGDRRVYKSKVLTPYETGNGHLQVRLYVKDTSKSYYAHRLAAQAFIPNPTGLPFINHKDSDKLNNVIGNLEWCTQAYNVAHSVPSGTRGYRARAVINCRGEEFFTLKQAAESYGLKSTTGIICVCKGLRNYSGTYSDGTRIKWKYIDKEKEDE